MEEEKIDYVISGVWMHEDNIEHVMLHGFLAENLKHDFVVRNTLSLGEKTPVSEVIKLSQSGKIIYTIVWDYSDAAWMKKDKVTHFENHGVQFLTTIENRVITNNISDLIDMAPIKVA